MSITHKIQSRRMNKFEPRYTKLQFVAVDYCNENLTPYERGILFSLFSFMRYDGYIKESQRDIASFIKIDVSNLNKTIKRLIDLGLLERKNGKLRLCDTVSQCGDPHYWQRKQTLKEVKA